MPAKVRTRDDALIQKEETRQDFLALNTQGDTPGLWKGDPVTSAGIVEWMVPPNRPLWTLEKGTSTSVHQKTVCATVSGPAHNWIQIS